jgi:hypothetical protein
MAALSKRFILILGTVNIVVCQCRDVARMRCDYKYSFTEAGRAWLGLKTRQSLFAHLTGNSRTSALFGFSIDEDFVVNHQLRNAADDGTYCARSRLEAAFLCVFARPLEGDIGFFVTFG